MRLNRRQRACGRPRCHGGTRRTQARANAWRRIESPRQSRALSGEQDLAIRQPRLDIDDGDTDAGNGDLHSSVRLSGPETLARGFRNYDRFSVTLRESGAAETTFEREVLRSGAVVGVLPVDFMRREIVLIRQFR